MAQSYPESFIFIIDSLADNMKNKLTLLLAGKTELDFKKTKELAVNIKRLFDELKKVHEIDENPKFIDLNNEVVNYLK